MRLVLCIVSLMFVFACESENTIDEADREEIYRTFQTGVDQKEDPFVRAETLRVLEIVGDKNLNRFAEPLLKDDESMVSVAALRALLAAGHPEIRLRTLTAYTDADAAEKRAILEAVLEYGSPPLKREITGRALRHKDELLREMAFREGQLARVDQAIEEGKTEYLERTLLPELVQYLDRDQGVLGAMALRKFLNAGKTERIEPLVRDFENPRFSVEDRIKAGKMLVYARATGARPAFEKVVAKYDRVMKDESLGIPAEVVPPEMLRTAILGAVAAGNTELVPRAKEYLTNATIPESLEILEALAENPSEDAEISLRIAMQDARDDVRKRAIALYEARDGASVEALMKAQRGAPYATQRRIANVLIERYPDQWVKLLKEALNRTSDRAGTLLLLRDVIITRDEVEMIVAPLTDELDNIVKNGKDDDKTLAAYLMALVNGVDKESLGLLDQQFDDETRYAFLEFQMRTRPGDSQALFRKYFNADNYATRLMSAAGLWKIAGPVDAEEAAESETESEDSEETAEKESS